MPWLVVIVTPLFSPPVRARVRYCEDERSADAPLVTTPRARWTTSWRPVVEAAPECLRSTCGRDEDQWVQGTIRRVRRVPRPPVRRKRSDARAQTARWHERPTPCPPVPVARVRI